jgi:hypothetical protein
MAKADEQDTQPVPTAAEMEQGAEVVAAGQQAAAAETDPTKRKAAASEAIRETAREKGFTLSQQEADILSDMIADKLADRTADRTVDRIREAGGFDRLPDPVNAPAAPTGGGTLPAEPPAGGQAAPAPEDGPEPPKSFAARFRTGKL